MSTKRNLAKIAAVLGAVAAMLVAQPRAEVGSLDPTAAGSGSNGYVFAGIIDAPDPLPDWWGLATGARAPFVPLNPSGSGNGDGAPSVLFNPVSGLTVVAWAQNTAAGFDVVLSVFENGAWSPPQVLAGDPANELDPFLFLGPDGTVHLVYWVDSTPRQVMHREAPADLSIWSDPVRVSQAGEEACRPAGIVYEETVRVAYEVHNFGYGQTPRQIVLARREGSVFVREIVAVSSYAGEIRPQPHAHGGRFWVDWVDADHEAAWVRLDASGAWEPVRYEPFGGVLEREFLVRRAIRLKAIH